MRYWIYWNDLVQGPFELEELTTLKAFSEELPVCLEDRQDWMPASRVADLSPAIEQLRSRNVPPMPPPPPPRGNPLSSTLQGEFFAERSDQLHMFETGDFPDGPQAFVRPDEGFVPPGIESVSVTMPIRFSSALCVAESPVRVAAQVPAPAPAEFDVFKTSTITLIQQPVITESPVAVEEIPPPTPPAVEQKTFIPLEILPDEEQLEAPARQSSMEIRAEERPAETVDVLSSTDLDVSQIREDVATEPSQPFTFPWRTAAWTVGVVTLLFMLGSLGYWLFDYSTSRAAIAAARPKAGALTKSVAVPVIAIPPAVTAPVRGTKRTKTSSPAPKIVRKKQKKTVIAVAPIAPIAPAAKMTPKRAVVVAMPVVPVVPVAPIAPPAPVAPIAPVATAPKREAVDPWIGRHNDAITLVMEKKVAGNRQTIGTRARLMLEEMHDKELLHAADTGERLYSPDKISWSALREEGSRYRVYLNFSSWQPNGDRVQTRSYQFLADLAPRTILTDDATARQDFLDAKTPLIHKRDPRAENVESMLSAVDQLNKHKMRLIIVKNSRKNRAEMKKIDADVATAVTKLQRAMSFFRTQYSEQMLSNVAKAYMFMALVK